MAFSLLLFIYSVLLSLVCTYIPGVCNFFTSGFVGCWFCCNQFCIFLAFELVQCLNLFFVQIEKKVLLMHHQQDCLCLSHNSIGLRQNVL